MIIRTPLPNALHAAARARAIAGIARRRSVLNHPAEEALTTVAELLDDVALTFETDLPPVLDGVVITNTIPFDASLLLAIAEDVIAQNTATGLPACLGQYVTSAVFGTLELPRLLHPVSAQLASQETSLRAALQLLHERHLTGAGERPETAGLYLEAAFKLHLSWGRLAAAVAVDNARPCNRPTVAQ
ncbi:hypothetical protein [Streptomyces vietnamensis]|uniref:Uncharacterized protein n=1 Tax=Streptomyces vietnamensis TaxID=362257 RepID=A0A0B5IJ25_9ACTN|nr:hypothetical protein [Streptomyces vietnamensis]AJF70477.1 hypothetical protein SVTN_40680 [Streptomyces vietnamensis]